MIKDPSGPIYFHFDPPSRVFDPILRLGHPSRGNRPTGHLDPSVERDAIQLATITARLAWMAHESGRLFSIAAPHPSLFWALPPIVRLLQERAVAPAIIDHCQYVTPGQSRANAERVQFREKVIGNHPAISALHRTCSANPGDKHDHRPPPSRRRLGLRVGRVPRSAALLLAWGTILFDRFAAINTDYFASPHFEATKRVRVAQRKRPWGTPTIYAPHRQFVSGEVALAAGYQMRKGVLPSIFPYEMEPGEAIAHVAGLEFPFDAAHVLPQPLLDAATRIADDPTGLNDARQRALSHWLQRARDLAPASIAALQAIPDPEIRTLLYRGDHLGQFFHIKLAEEMVEAAGHRDPAYIAELCAGLPIAGPIARSGLWPPDNIPSSKTIPEFIEHARLYRQELEQSIRYTNDTRTIWDQTKAEREIVTPLLDVRGSPRLDQHGNPMTQTLKVTDGPWTADQITEVEGPDWAPIRRFPVWQKGKCRGCDDGHRSWLNATTSREEKLRCTSVDFIIAMISALRSRGVTDLRGWAIDEMKAYRQIPVRPEHRRYAIVAVMNPDDHKIYYFRMLGHSFGFTAAVYSYNRRPMLVQSLLQELFSIHTAHYYDDRWAIESGETIMTSRDGTIEVFNMLGILIEQSKMQGPGSPDPRSEFAPTILGVNFDLERFIVQVADTRKEQLLEEIAAILEKDRLGSGQAGKLKGKLFFASSQFLGKCGRAALRALSERQYSCDFDTRLTVNGQPTAAKKALLLWQGILTNGRPRPIPRTIGGPADAILCTDGFFPNPRLRETGHPRVGGVLFTSWRSKPVAFSKRVDEAIMERWFKRETQINQVELLALVAAMEAYGPELEGKRVIALVDSEGALGAAIKGYSVHRDVSDLVTILWESVSRWGIILYLDRISTDANISDGPSRDDWAVARECDWVTEHIDFPRV